MLRTSNMVAGFRSRLDRALSKISLVAHGDGPALDRRRDQSARASRSSRHSTIRGFCLWFVVGYFGLFDLGLGHAMTPSISESLGRHPNIVYSGLSLMILLGAAGTRCSGWRRFFSSLVSPCRKSCGKKRCRLFSFLLSDSIRHHSHGYPRRSRRIQRRRAHGEL